MTASGDADLLVRVRKLLDKAEATTNSHEADAFSRKAAELIAADRIDPDRLAVVDAGDDLRVREIEIGRGAYVRARLALLQAVADANDVRVVFQARPHGTVAMAAGFRSDLDVVEVMYTSLHQQASSQMASVRRQTGAATQRFRRSFLFGFAERIGEVLGESKQRAAAQVHSDDVAVRTARALATTTRNARVDEFAATSFGRVRTARAPSAAQVGGWGAGAAAANRGRGQDPAPRARSHRPGRPVVSEADHAALYAAELAAFDGTDLEEVQPFETIRAVLHHVIAGSWWPAGHVEVRHARADAGSSSTRCSVDEVGARATISLAGPQMTIATAAHELAHVLAGPGHGHDAVYRRAYLDTVRVMTNLDPTDRRMGLHVDQLRLAFIAHGLAVGERSWPEPAQGTGSAFAL